MKTVANVNGVTRTMTDDSLKEQTPYTPTTDEVETAFHEFALASPPMFDVDKLTEVIWRTSRADEGTISVTGANIVARAVVAHLRGGSND